MSIGSIARETRSTSRRGAVFADDEVIRAKPFDRLALLVDRADKHRALARRLRVDRESRGDRTRDGDSQSQGEGPTKSECCAHEIP